MKLLHFGIFKKKFLQKNIQANGINLTIIGHKDLYTSIGLDFISLDTEEVLFIYLCIYQQLTSNSKKLVKKHK